MSIVNSSPEYIVKQVSEMEVGEILVLTSGDAALVIRALCEEVKKLQASTDRLDRRFMGFEL